MGAIRNSKEDDRQLHGHCLPIAWVLTANCMEFACQQHVFCPAATYL